MSATNRKMEALQEALTARDPFCSGVCPVSEDLLSVYYTQGTDIHVIDFVGSNAEELEALSRACRPVSSDLSNRDETHQKIDVNGFSTSFDPRRLRIHELIEQELLSSNLSVEVELCELNIYEKGESSKAYQDTPRGDNLFSTLLVVLPVPHKGGQLSLRVDYRRWIIDFTEQFAKATTPTICFVAFFGDVEHQILPVTSGHRVTLTYNLYFRVVNSLPRALPGPFYVELKEALIDLIDDPTTLPDGGYLGFGLRHEYEYDERKPIDSLLLKLKGSDAALTSICTELGLSYTLRLLYAEDLWECHFHLLSRVKLTAPQAFCHRGNVEDSREDYLLKEAVRNLASEDLEVVDIIGRPVPRGRREIHDNSNGSSDWDPDEEDEAYQFLMRFYKEPVPQVLEFTEMYSVTCETSYAHYGGKIVSTETFYGRACLVISVGSKGPRENLARVL